MAFVNTIESLGEEWQTIDGLPQPTYDSREELSMCYARYILLVHSQKAINDNYVWIEPLWSKSIAMSVCKIENLHVLTGVARKTPNVSPISRLLRILKCSIVTHSGHGSDTGTPPVAAIYI